MAKIIIRLLDKKDTKQYTTCRLVALKTAPEAFGSDYETTSQKSAEFFEQRASFEPENFMVGAFDAGKLIGTVGYYSEQFKNGRHRGNIVGVFLYPTYRGKGIAQKMFALVIDQVEKTLPHIKQIHLGVATSNTPAVKLYASFGFERYGTEPRSLYVNGDYIDEYLMVRKLDGVTGGTEETRRTTER